MSATYKCNFCNKLMSKHVSCYEDEIEIHRQLYKNPNVADFWITFEISSTQEDLDICNECLRRIKKEAIKKLEQISIK